MNFDADDIEIAFYCAAAAIRSRQVKEQPIPEQLHRHYDRLYVAIRCMSHSGHENDGQPSQSEPDELITARQAATMLELTKRQVLRLAPDLDGRIIDGRWLFPRSSVETAASERRNAS